mgnify:CR=1 FL=1
MGGILLYQNALEERADNIYAPLNNPLIGYASDDANNTEDIRRGSRNLTESKEVDGGYRFVWDFATSQANGTISAICYPTLWPEKERNMPVTTWSELVPGQQMFRINISLTACVGTSAFISVKVIAWK